MNSPSPFECNSATGEISVKGDLRMNQYMIDLLVNDSLHTASMQLRVDVLPSDLSSVYFPQTLYDVVLTKDIKLGIPFMTVTAVSTSGVDLAYTIVSGHPDSMFSIDIATGLSQKYIICRIISLIA